MSVRAHPLRRAVSAGRRLRYTLPGAWVALVFAALSFTPSLVPRGALFQGVVTGITAMFGYAVGVLAAFVWREFADRPARPATRREWRIFYIVATVLLLVSILLGQRWQRQLRELFGVPSETGVGVLLIPVVAATVFVVLVAIGRLVRAAYGRLARLLARRMGARAARATGLVVLAGTLALLVSGVLWDTAVGIADRTYALRDTLTPGNVEQPDTPLRSGGPGSFVVWDSLGREGRKFVGGGPDAAAISEFTGSPAQEPIRAYAGIASAEDTEARARLAVSDVQRAGGFDRSHLLVVTTTGTGWVEPSSTASFEYLTGGDSAIVSMQYSHLPSVLSFLVDQQKAREAGRELFDAVYERWLRLPADDRPRLLVFGESLGSFGAETAFSGEFDLRNRVSGALFTGPPNFNPLYRQFVDRRDAGSREVEPEYRAGRTIRFTNLPRVDIEPADQPWSGTRVLYMQHASDPITWWSPDLMLQSPDWLEEAPGRDVLDEMRWYPFVTFWQVSADLALGFSMPPGHGHTFRGEHVDGWAAVLQPDGWSAEKADRLRAIIRKSAR